MRQGGVVAIRGLLAGAGCFAIAGDAQGPDLCLAMLCRRAGRVMRDRLARFPIQELFLCAYLLYLLFPFS